MNSNYSPNFADPNLNIDLPIFIIHGNHDHPIMQDGNLSVLDLLHTGKYVLFVLYY
jgi:double-strand break repair protein MRE11